MSLINDMLRDLDSRNAASSERGGLAHNVRALPQKAERRIHPLLLAVAAAGVGGAAVWLYLRPTAPAPVMPAPMPVAVAPIAEVPATPVAPAVAPVDEATAAQVPTALPAIAPGTTGATPQEPPTLRLDTRLDKPPTVAKPAARLPQLRAAETGMPAPATPAADRAATQPPTDNAARGAARPQISKQPAGGNSAEQADLEYRRGLAAIKRGDTTEAGEALRSALHLSPAHIGARQALLGQLTEQQRWADAETLALDGVGLLPQRAEWALLAARLMYERGEADLALETLNQHAAAARQNADYQIMHALLLQRAGRYADAANCYRTALALRPNEGRWWFGLGRALDADRRDGEARQAYEKARESGNLPPDLQQSVDRRLKQG